MTRDNDDSLVLAFLHSRIPVAVLCAAIAGGALVAIASFDVAKAFPNGLSFTRVDDGTLTLEMDEEYIDSYVVVLRWTLPVAVAFVMAVLYYVYHVSKGTRATLTREAAITRGAIAEANAVIPDKEQKVVLVCTARDDFFNPEVYVSAKSKASETYDLLRMDSAVIHDLFLTPKYLEYFFYRCKNSELATKIVVVDRASWGVLVYLSLCVFAGYRTYVICLDMFRRVVEGQGEAEGKILCGNPYVAVRATLEGQYSPYLHLDSPQAEAIPPEMLNVTKQMLVALAASTSELTATQLTLDAIEGIFKFQRQQVKGA